jgi:hypothetical protein
VFDFFGIFTREGTFKLITFFFEIFFGLIFLTMESPMRTIGESLG